MISRVLVAVRIAARIHEKQRAAKTRHPTDTSFGARWRYVAKPVHFSDGDNVSFAVRKIITRLLQAGLTPAER